MKNDDLIFADEDNDIINNDINKWKVLIIDDDKEVHAVTKLALHDFEYDNKGLDLVSAYSAKNAKELLTKEPGFAFVLLDIVMESNDAGLNVINYIRNILKNKLIRIIIRTGQPGYAPEQDIINQYDINDYKEKTELTTTKLYTTTRTALSQYKQLSELENKKNELYNTLMNDAITSLYSRAKLYNDLKDIKKGSMILIDIDSFSTINNAYGYTVGDQILREVAIILKDANIDTKLIYRIESDNFVLLFEDKEDDYLFQTSLNLKFLLTNKYFNIDDLTLYINVSIGISNYANENLLQKAEIAVHASRKKQDNKIEFYSEELDTIKIINNNLLWSKRLSKAIEENNIITYFQPIVECKTKKIVKYETLVRLIYKDTVYAPIHFLAAARNAGLLTKITQIVFKQACEVFSKNDLEFSINITNHDLMDKKFVENLLNTSTKYQISTERISLEILEEKSIRKNLYAQNNLIKLREVGFLLSIDDFGVDYSNFSQLKSLDINSVKIDGSFIEDIHNNKYSEYITEAILSYAKKIKVKTIAEYVHSEEVFDKINSLGIEYAQGYYFGKPQKELQ
jgi:diguanylate cyclase (GGDEF)-like protein